MSEHSASDAVLADRVTFWRNVHEGALEYWDANEGTVPLLITGPEMQAHEAFQVLHALSHAWLENLGVESYPNCRVGPGDILLERHGFEVSAWANK